MLNKRMRLIRMEKRHTQQSTADKLNVSLRTYQKYEQGTVQPSIQTLILFADYMNVSIDWLLCRDDYLKSLGVSFDGYQ